MDLQIKEYFSVLGISPGVEPEQIKKAFRDKIKLCHPDRSVGEEEKARKIIEAYNYFKENPDAAKTASVAAAEAVSENPYFDAGRAAGERIFKGVFRGRPGGSHRVSEDFPQSPPRKKSPSPVQDKGEMMYERAEMVLKETVRRYNRQMNRPRRSWAKEYISHLANIQVLYRDVSVRYPYLGMRARRRLTQVQELVAEIKHML